MADSLSAALALAQRQHGVVRRAQVFGAGVHRRTIDRLVQSGRWEIISRGVYRVVGAPRTWEQRALALVLAAGDDAVVSHRSAAYLYGLDGFGPPGRIEI